MIARRATVFIVDDDPGVCRAMSRLVRGAGYAAREFSSARDFLLAHEPEPPGCVLLDVSMPDLDGLELQQRLLEQGCQRPIVFLTASDDSRNVVRAIKAGAIDYLTKPVEAGVLLAALTEACRVDACGRANWERRNLILGRLALLTPRERQVLEMVLSGFMNKQIAAQLGTVEKTIKVHRSRVMNKLHAGSLLQLVALAQAAGVPVSGTHGSPT